MGPKRKRAINLETWPKAFWASSPNEWVKSATGKATYEFGNLSKWLDQKSKEKVGAFTNNNETDYQFGDISKEVMRRVSAGEYTREDLLLLIKIVAVVGINFQPTRQ